VNSAVGPGPRIGLLGGFELSLDGDVLSTSAPGQRLLALLVLTQHGRPGSRLALAERLWPDLPAERASTQLRSVLWRLPRPRGRSFVVARGPTVRVADDVRIDLWEAEAVARRILAGHDAGPVAGPDTVTDPAVLDLLGQDLLPDWHDSWLSVDQESFRQRRLHALERVASELRHQGRFTDALTVALTAVRCEPLRESAHRVVIEVHLVEGNHAEALRQFHRYRQLIAEELGLPPSPVIRSLVGSLLGRPGDM